MEEDLEKGIMKASGLLKDLKKLPKNLPSNLKGMVNMLKDTAIEVINTGESAYIF